jgi:hypothetical protein
LFYLPSPLPCFINGAYFYKLKICDNPCQANLLVNMKLSSSTHSPANILQAVDVGEHGDRKWVSNRGGAVKPDLYRPEEPRWNPLGLSIYTQKKMKAEGWNRSFQRWVLVGGGTQGKGEWGWIWGMYLAFTYENRRMKPAEIVLIGGYIVST